MAGKKPSDELNLRLLARTLGVNVSTVSRALAGKPGVSPARARQVTELAASLGYRPRPYREKYANCIGLIVPVHHQLVEDYLMKLITLTIIEADRHGKHVHLDFLRYDARPARLPAVVRENRVDGVCLAGSFPARFHAAMRQHCQAVVSLSETIERTGNDSVLASSREATRELVRGLAAMGHRRIGLVLTDPAFPSMRHRKEAYLAECHAGGLPLHKAWLVEGVSAAQQGGQEAVRRYLHARQLPTAIIFGNDQMAMGGAFELARSGYRIPEDVSIAGYNNTEAMQELSPALTSIDNQAEEIVRQGMDLLMDRIAHPGGPPRQIVLQNQVHWRASTAPLV
ncbi:MAG: LacI family transcriptional regulator [Candidatus Marinimicrobia bacterium]|nr:LacI family transcriptional regulator [Candidatus Neomarinimicrobiota bacterium]